MSRPPRFERAAIGKVAESGLGTSCTGATYLAVGWGNENWKVTTTAGDRFLVKCGPPDSAGKWAATHRAAARAAAVGVPVAELVHFDPSCPIVDGWVVRILRWVDADDPEQVLASGDTTVASRLFTQLGTAVRAMHGLAEPAFSSRLDGSAKRFDSWADYVDYRLPQIRERVRATAAFDHDEADGVAAEIRALAATVAPDVAPVLCHRDLHLGNVLVTSDGDLAAILDFDGAEAWDAAVDVVKLRWLVFPQYAGAEDAFVAAYTARAPLPAHWEDRVYLAELLELVNAVANARATHDEDFERSARQRLTAVRGQRPT